MLSWASGSLNDNVAVVAAVFERMQARDWAAVEALFAPDAAIDYPATLERFVGTGFVAMNRDYPEGWRIEIAEVFGVGPRVVARVAVHHGDELFWCAGFYTVADGVIVGGTEYWVTQGGEPAPQWRAPYWS